MSRQVAVIIISCARINCPIVIEYEVSGIKSCIGMLHVPFPHRKMLVSTEIASITIFRKRVQIKAAVTLAR